MSHSDANGPEDSEQCGSLRLQIGTGDPMLDELRSHLVCAQSRDVLRAIEFHRLGEDELSEARKLERGRGRRCQACRTIIQKNTWRLAAIYFDGALHLECALEHEPTGFRFAIERSSEFADTDAWLSRLDAGVLDEPIQ